MDATPAASLAKISFYMDGSNVGTFYVDNVRIWELADFIGGPPTPGIGFGAGIERLVAAVQAAGVAVEPELLDVYFVLAPDAPREELLLKLAEARGAGLACDTDYAGRSLKSQLDLGHRRARTVVIRSPDGWIIRQRGERDAEVDASALLERLQA